MSFITREVLHDTFNVVQLLKRAAADCIIDLDPFALSHENILLPNFSWLYGSCFWKHVGVSGSECGHSLLL